jgi:hypothetical protein
VKLIFSGYLFKTRCQERVSSGLYGDCLKISSTNKMPFCKGLVNAQ